MSHRRLFWWIKGGIGTNIQDKTKILGRNVDSSILTFHHAFFEPYKRLTFWTELAHIFSDHSISRSYHQRSCWSLNPSRVELPSEKCSTFLMSDHCSPSTTRSKTMSFFPGNIFIFVPNNGAILLTPGYGAPRLKGGPTASATTEPL